MCFKPSVLTSKKSQPQLRTCSSCGSSISIWADICSYCKKPISENNIINNIASQINCTM